MKAKNEKLGWEEEFEGLMVIAIDEGLKSIVGEASTKVIYYQLEKIFQIGMNELIKNSEKLTEGLEKIFGYGARILETAILQKLYEKLNLNFKEKESCKFKDYIEEAKKYYQQIKLK